MPSELDNSIFSTLAAVVILLFSLTCLPRYGCTNTNGHCTTEVTHTGSCYWEESGPLSWYDAKRTCQDKGGALAVAATSTQQSALEDKFTLSDHEHWLGATDQEVEGIFRWSDGTLSNWNNWESNRPDGEINQNCLLLLTSKKWDDKSCSDTERFICMSTPTTSCTNSKDNCYGQYQPPARCYEKISGSGTFDEHHTACTGRGLVLARVYDQEDLDTISSLVNEHAWLDGKLSDEYIWRWGDGNVVSWVKWKSDEPNNWDNERCIKFDEGHVYMKSQSCDSGLNNIVCMSTGCNAPPISNANYVVQNNSVIYTCTNGFQDSDGTISWSGSCCDATAVAAQHACSTVVAIPTIPPTLSTMTSQTDTMVTSNQATASPATSSQVTSNGGGGSPGAAVPGSETSSPGSGTSSQGSGTSSQGSGTSSQGSGTSSQGAGTSSQGPGTSSQGSDTSSQDPGTVPSVATDPNQTNPLVTSPGVQSSSSTAAAGTSGDSTSPGTGATVQTPPPEATTDARTDVVTIESATQTIPQSQGTPGNPSSPEGPESTVTPREDITDTPDDFLQRCDSPPNLPNADLTMSQSGPMVAGVAVIYTCKPGYMHEGGGQSRSYVCIRYQGKRKWHFDITDCIVKTCPPVAPTRATPSWVEAQAGETTSFYCDDDMRFIDGRRQFSVTCGLDKRWSIPASLIDCRENRCPPLQVIANAFVTDPYTSDRGSYVNVTCKQGHRFVDGLSSKSFLCSETPGTADSSWELGEFDTCYIDVCPQLPVLPNMTYNTSFGVFGDVVEATCLYGFTYGNGTTSEYIQCGVFGIWETDPRPCAEVICPDPPEALNAQRLVDGYRLDDVTTYTCASGMRTDEGNSYKTIKCTVRDTWSESQISCAPGRCNSLPPLVFASQDIVASDAGVVVTLTCDMGHRFPGNVIEKRVKCQNDQQWNDTYTECRPVDCGNATMYPNTSPNSTDTLFLSDVYYECSTGFQWTHQQPPFITCQANGTWSPLPARCEPTPCLDFPTVYRAVYHTDRFQFFYKDNLTFVCDPGSWFSRDTYSLAFTCGPEGSWIPARGECKDITCLHLRTWDGVSVSSNNIHVGVKVNVTCEDEYVLAANSSSYLECMENGTWYPDYPKCNFVGGPAEEVVPTEAPSSEAIGSIAILLMCMLPAFIITLDSISFVTWLRVRYQHFVLRETKVVDISNH